jgi:hypothetical protein
MVGSIPYGEGDWFAVPLREGGYCLGLVARVSREEKGVLLGYFFGPRREVLPELEQTLSLSADQAVLVARFGHLGLLNGEWPLLGQNGLWKRGEWPMPVFGRKTSLGLTYRVEYSDTDALRSMRTTKVSAEEIEGLPEDGMGGAGFIATRLTRLLTA